MSKKAHFSVNPKLAALLGEGYRSSEHAIKELVDNAWDADAERVSVTLPREVSSDPVIIEDDGSGMTPAEVESEYLAIADGRRERRGEKTPLKRRRVKGRKGIGKFAGLMVAAEMELETTARGEKTRLVVKKSTLEAAVEQRTDLESVDLGLVVTKAPKSHHGTTIKLRSLNQRLHYPSPEKLKAILVREYGREQDFHTLVNGEAAGVEDVPGETFEKTIELPDIGKIRIKFTIGDEPTRNPGLALRVDGKIIGKPDLLGLDADELLPPKLSKYVYGEIEADGLARDVTADFGAVIENSKAHEAIRVAATQSVRGSVEAKFRREVGLAKARRQKELNARFDAIPEHRREAARRAVDKILRKFYGEQEDRIDAVLWVALEAFEADDYWVVLSEINDATRADVGKLAEALERFGLADMALLGRQARRRLTVLDEMDKLIKDVATLELQLHHVVEANPWILGNKYNLLRSNQTLATVLGDLAPKGRRKNRPDMLLAALPDSTHVLIEFKRPSHSIERGDESQAVAYRDDLSKKFPKVHVILIGKERSQNVNPTYGTDALEVLSWVGVISAARNELDWLLQQLKADAD